MNQEKPKSNVAVVKDLLEDNKQAIAECLPKHIPAEKLIRVVLTQMQNNPALKKCTPSSVIGSLLRSCLLGLEPDGRQGALIPYGTECTFQTMVQGELKLVRNSGEVSDIYAEVVREKDLFQIKKGLNRDLIHNEDPAQDGKLLGAYAVCVFKDGTKTFLYMTEKKIIERRNVSKAAKKAGSIWDKWPEEMWKKTVLKALCKQLPSEYEKIQNSDIMPIEGLKVLETLNLPTPEEEAADSMQEPKRLSESVDTDAAEDVSEREYSDEEAAVISKVLPTATPEQQKDFEQL